MNRHYHNEVERERTSLETGSARFQEDLSDLIQSESRKRALKEEDRRKSKRRDTRK